MAHDVFICYSSEDRTIANAACAKLESAGIRCWIAPRDPIAGIPYGRQLVEAIGAARVVLLIFSGNANRSEHVLRELEVASDSGKIIVPFRIEDVVPSGDLRYYITRVHWLDAMSPPMEARLNELVSLMQRLLDMPITPAPPLVPAAAKRKPFGALHAAFAVIGLLLVAAAIAVALWFTRSHKPASAIAARATTHPRSVKKAQRTPAQHAPAVAAAATPQIVYVSAPPQLVAVPKPATAAPPVMKAISHKPLPRPRVAKTAAATKVAAAPRWPPDQSAAMPWSGPSNYQPDWRIGDCAVASQTLYFYTIPSGPYAGMKRLVSKIALDGSSCALKFSYAFYSASHAYLGTLTERYSAYGFSRREQGGTWYSNFPFDSTRFGTAAYVVREASHV